MRHRISSPRISLLLPFSLAALLLAASGARAVQTPNVRLAGPPLRLTADQLGAQAPSLASDRAGNFIAVWFSRRDDGTSAVVARKFGASGQPLGPEVEVARNQYPYGQPRVAVAPDGGSVVVWTHLHSDGPGHGLLLNGVEARRLAPDGQPAGAAVLLTDGFSCCDVLPDIAFLSSGQFVVVWYQEFSGFYLPEPIPQEQPVLGRIFDLAFSPRSDVFTVVGGVGARELARVRADPAGGFAVAWHEAFWPNLSVRRFNADGSARGPEVTFVAPQPSLGPVPMFSPQGELSVVWAHPSPTGALDSPGIFAQKFGIDGNPVGSRIQLAEGMTLDSAPDAADDAAGHRFLVWAAPVATQEGPVEIRVRSFDTAWQATGPALPVTSFTQRRDPNAGFLRPPWPAIAAGPANFLTVWDELQSPTAPPNDPLTQVAAQALGGSCLSTANSLCLADAARFRAQVSWQDPRTGLTGTASAVPLTSDTGAFWFFSAGNAELLVKVLDGRTVNGNWWVFFGALTDLAYDLTVTDTQTGAQQVYHNPAYHLASRADVRAFPEEPAAGSAAELARSAATPEPQPSQSCGSGLCIGPFAISVEFTDPRNGQTGTATGVPLGGDSGMFWFFDRDNIELLIKVLDGRSLNGHWWVFFGALTDVEYTIRVTKTDENITRRYHNPHGRMVSRADTQAF